MQRLKIQPTESSFSIDLNIEKGEFIFLGESRPENAPRFFDPVLDWLNDFENLMINSKRNYDLKVIFKLDYFNSTSTKYLVDISKVLKRIGDIDNVNQTVEWYYKEIDEDIEESGRELIEWTGLDIQLIPYD
ncbi:MAG: hypothetical protein COA32_13260 [Fluviicola sp.]|nr:MAG: hypothetical protein COA32_13260 [Fluviicola sp.]